MMNINKPWVCGVVGALLSAAGLIVGGEPEAVRPAVTATNQPPPLGVLGMVAAMQAKAGPLDRAMAQELQQGNLVAAEKTCRKFIQELPMHPNGYYNLSCVLARQGRHNEAMAQLEQAVEHGFHQPGQMEEDPDLAGLRGDARFAELVSKASRANPIQIERKIEPALVTNGIAWVGDGNTMMVPGGVFTPLFKFDLEASGQRAITTLNDEAGVLLRKLWGDGTAAGNFGDLYDNRDGGHSEFSQALFPSMAWVHYGPEAKALHLDYGLPTQVFHRGGPVIGNASLAATSGPYWRRLVRSAYTKNASFGLLQAQYMANQLYVYPCHHDYSPGHNGKHLGQAGGHGDVFAVNTPYVITSQGSSGSDQVFLQALAATMAAFRPEVKQLLIEKRMLAPTLQMIFRMSSKSVTGTSDYLTGRAHPPVFQGGNIDRLKMVRMAQGMTPGKLPPLVGVKVVEENKMVPGRDFFDPIPTEAAFDTPFAIARIMRGTPCWRRMVVSAEAAKDPNGLPLKWHWVVLQGNEKAVRIKPLKKDYSVVELAVAYQRRRSVQPGAALESNRIDIGAFVHNGSYFSPPAFVCFYTLDNEERDYDDEDRILSVTYRGAQEPGNYVDPLVALAKSWRDEYHYDPLHHITGWTRIRGVSREEFNEEGRLIVRRNDAGRPIDTRPVRYVVKPRTGQAPVVEQVLVEDRVK